MREEIRTIEVQKTVYISDDGNVFNDPDNCREYEIRLLEEKLIGYDDKFNKCDFQSCTYLNLITEEDVKNFIKVTGYRGMFGSGVNGPGIYMYVDDYCRSDTWVNLDDVIFRIRGGLTDEKNTDSN